MTGSLKKSILSLVKAPKLTFNFDCGVQAPVLLHTSYDYDYDRIRFVTGRVPT